MAKKPNTFNSIVNFLVLGVLAYAIITTYFYPAQQTSKDGHANDNGELYTQSKAPGTFDQFTKLIGIASTAMQPVINISSETKGTGSNVICGQSVTYEYSDKAIGTDEYVVKNQRHTFVIGAPPLIEGHLKALAGMQVGGERTVQYSSRWGYQDSGPEALRSKDLQSHIKLISATPKAPDSSMPYRVFYKQPHAVAQTTFDCGAQVRAKFELWTVGGQKLYPPANKEPEWTIVRIGHGQVPVGIEEVLQRMSQDESVTAILPYELLGYFSAFPENGLLERPFVSVVFPKNQAILVDIKNVQAIEGTTADSPGSETQSTPTEKAAPAAESKP